jgi:uncharacterized cupin superfamily protein
MTSTTPNLHVAALASLDLGEPKPKPTSVSGDQLEASRIVWKSPDGTTQIGVWECSPGVFTATREGYSEIAHLIYGRCTLVTDDGTRTEHGPGDLIVTDQGWTGIWEVHEPVRKLFVIHRSASDA